MGTTSYAIALGSNRRHGRHGSPARVIEAALVALEQEGVTLISRSAVRATPAFGGAGRSFANAAALIDTDMAPRALLALFKRLERRFGRRRGRRWAARVLDLDILLWSGGVHLDAGHAAPLAIPHPRLAERAFVLQPLLEIAPDWRHPLLAAHVRQLWVRLHRAKPVDRLRCYP